MSNLGQRIASVVTTLVFLLILWAIFDRIRIVIWVQTPWWAFLLMIGLLYLIVDYVVHRAFGKK